MAVSSEIIAKLGLDTSKFRAELRNIPAAVQREGSNAARAIQSKLDIRQGMNALATAIGLNLQRIAENFARFVTGMSSDLQKGLENLVPLSDRVTEAVITNMRNVASEETRYQLLLLERERILKRLANGTTEEPLPDPSLIAQIRSTAMFGHIPNPFFDGGAALADEMNAARLQSLEKDKLRLTQLSGEIKHAEDALDKKSDRAADEANEVRKRVEKLDLEKQTTKELERQGEARSELLELSLAEAAAVERKLEAEIALAVAEFNAAAEKSGFEKITASESDELAAWVRGGKAGPAPKISREGALRESLNDGLVTFGNEFLGPIRKAGDFAQASQDVIEESIYRYDQLIQRLKTMGVADGLNNAASAASGDYARALAISQVEENRRLAQRELDMRRMFTGMPRAQALRTFDGDPLAFDRLYESSKGMEDKTRQMARDISDLKKMFLEGRVTVRSVSADGSGLI